MTLTEWQVESERIKVWEKQTGTHRCAICHSGLVVRWNPEKSRMELACSQDKTHEGIEPYSASKERLRRFIMEETKALAVKDPGALATQVQAKFPKDLNPDQAKEFVQICLAYGFDPLLGELMPYQGRPYISLDARLRRAQKHPAWQGWSQMNMRPATEEEKKGRGYAPDDIVAVVQVKRKNTEQPLVFGRVTVKEVAEANAFLPLKKDPYAHAEKRAMHKALRQAFADTIRIPALEGLEEMGITVDTSTGEILDSAEETPEATVSPEGQGVPSKPQADAQHGQEAPPTPQPAAQAQAVLPQGKVMTSTEFWLKARELGYDDATKTELTLGKTVPRWLRDGGTYRTALIALQAAKGQGQGGIG